MEREILFAKRSKNNQPKIPVYQINQITKITPSTIQPPPHLENPFLKPHRQQEKKPHKK